MSIKERHISHCQGKADWKQNTLPPSPSADYITYVIQTGDTLMSIAARYGTTVSILARLNGISESDRIIGGKTLKVPENSQLGT